jgi:hypothetical protein
MNQTIPVNFIHLSAVLVRRFWLWLIAGAAAGAVLLSLLQLALPERYQAVAVVTLTDWQTERLSRRDDATDKNPANVGGASADEVSRALVRLKQAEFYQSFPTTVQPEQLSVEHKRRGNLVTLKWTSRSALAAENELQTLVQLWDQQWRQQFIQQRQQQLLQLAQLKSDASLLQQQLQFELEYAEQAQPFALQYLQVAQAEPQPEAPALWLVLLTGALLGFSCSFMLLMLWRL